VRAPGRSRAAGTARLPDRDDLAAARTRLFDLIESTEHLIWMLLTKRPANIATLAARYASGWPPNVWLGTSAETQRFATERIPHLVEHDVTVRFVSAGPTLGMVDMTRIPRPSVQQPDMVWDVLGKRYGVPDRWQAPMSRGIDWLITEGESGQKAGIRPSHPDWYRTLRDQAVAAGVPFHHKQNGVWVAKDQLAKIPDRYEAKDWVRNPQRHLMLAANGRRKPVGDWDGTEDLGGRWAWMLRFPTTKEPGRLLDGEVWEQFPEAAGV
jgi:protein gp37